MKSRSLMVASLALALAAASLVALRDRNGEPAPAPEPLPGSTPSLPDAAEAPRPRAERPLAVPTVTIGPGSRDEPADACPPDTRPSTATTSDAALDPAAARELLLVSQDPEHLAAAALLSADSADRVADITRAMASGRDDAVVVWTAMRICDRAGANRAGANAGCPAQDWEAEMLRLDGGNSEVWMHVAVGRWRRGDNAAALEAVQRAGASPETRLYSADSIELLERALASTGGYSFSERALTSIRLGAANAPDFAGYWRMCSEQAAASPVWADACLDYGRMAERHDRTELGPTMAGRAPLFVLQTNGQSNTELGELFARAMTRRASYDLWDRDSVVIGTPAEFSAYLATLRQQGELAARLSLPHGCVSASSRR